MKRLHVNLSVEDLDRSVSFYSTLFGTEPTVLKRDYAKWMLDDPRVNFALSTRASRKGLDHLGIQVEDETGLSEVTSRLKAAETRIVEQPDAVCCYARSDKTWSFDPEGIAWETFVTHGESPVYGLDTDVSADTGQACCTPGAPNPETRCCQPE
jgi:catechol 2,3-dioxygenase-like lactoylglutathione lyase family enzyme